MKRISIAVFGGIVAISAGAASAPKATCDFVVQFPSKCCGPDDQQIKHLGEYLRANDALVRFESRGFGKEGEEAFCVHVKSHFDLMAVKGHLERITGQPTSKKNTVKGSVTACLAAPEAIPTGFCADAFWALKKKE